MEEKRLLKRVNQYQEKGDKFQQAEALSSLGYYYNEKLSYEKALKYFETAGLMYRKLGKMLQYAQANRMIGEIYTNKGDCDKALNYQKIYLDIAQQENNDVELQRALTSVGRTYLTKAIFFPDKIDKNGLKLALESFQESLRMCDKLKNISKYEIADMKARAYLNIGVVYENLNEFAESSKNMTKAIHIWKTYEIYGQLYTGHHLMGLLYAKQNDHSTAIIKYNEAIENAKRVSNKAELICSTLLAKADSYIRICNYTRAKNALLKAYRMNTPNNEERELIARNLKITVVLCNSEKELLNVHEDDLFSLKLICERMGDASVNLNNFKTAIEYYKKMLKYAETSGETGIQLGKIYMSLAQTYVDFKNFDLALEYYQKELECAINSPEDSYLPLLNIAIVLDMMGQPFEDVVTAYKKARQVAKLTGNTSYLGKVIRSERVFYLKTKNMTEVAKCNKELENMNCVKSDSESEGDNENIGDDINIDDLSEPSDEESRTNTSPGNTRPVRNRKKTIAIKTNMKGETQLHLACISGDYKLVKGLIDQGHKVNIRDYSNWLPIHEACNYGSLKVIELLLQNGAYVNDAGYQGVTPLHDACGNGHLKVIKFLMDNGAHPVARTDAGTTPLDYLEDWYNKNQPLEQNDQDLYKLIVSRLKEAVERVGEQIGTRQENTPKSSKNSPLISQEYQRVGNLRHAVDNSDDLNYSKPTCSGVSSTNRRVERSMSISSSDSSSSNYEFEQPRKEVGSGKEYKQIMEQLRHRRPEEKNTYLNKSTIFEPLVDEDDVGDNWLEDDLGHSVENKKRKRDSEIINLLTTNTMRTSNSPETDSYVNLIMDVDDEQENVDPTNRCEYNIDNSKRRKSQVSLLNSGFSRRKSDSPTQFQKLFHNNVTLVDKIIPKPVQRQPKLNSFVSTAARNELECTVLKESYPTITQNQTVVPVTRNILAVNVKINNTIWKIPVPVQNLEQLTIDWLATEAAKRYYKKEGIRPTLQLYAKDGAMLENEDPLSLIFMDDFPDEIECTILSWDLPDINQRYKEACESSKTEMHPDIYQSLTECNTTTRLIIDEITIKREQYEPLFRSLKHEVNLQYLAFLNTHLLPDAFRQLCVCLPHLLQLKYLNFTMTNITNDSLKCLSDTFVSASKPILENLTELDLSYNLLNNDCLSHLSIILRHLRLKSLHIAGNCFTANILDKDSSIEFNFEWLETLDLSVNHFNQNDIAYFIKFLNFSIVTNLNCSNNSAVVDSQIVMEIVQRIQHVEACYIKTLNLARCHFTDSDVWKLLQVLVNVHTLETIDLAYNNELTSVTLRRILQHSPSFTTVSFEACWNVVTYLKQCETLEVPENSRLQSLSVSIDYVAYPEEMDILVSLWEQLWKKKSRIERKLRTFVHFTVMD